MDQFRECPYINDSNVDCCYLTGWSCEEVCAANSDAWCNDTLQKADMVDELKKVIRECVGAFDIIENTEEILPSEIRVRALCRKALKEIL